MEDPPPSNPYTTLNVPKDATLATIRSAHRKLILSCHPDKVQDETAKKAKAEQFHQVQQAYEILSDERRRQRYDEKVKLEELKAEMASDRGPPLSRRNTDFEYGPTRGGPPRREFRDNVIFETREPRNARYSDEDYPPPKYDTRSSPRTYDDYHPTSSIRRPSGRPTEEKRRARDVEDDRDRRRRERDEEAQLREQQTRRREKDRKQNTETKSRHRFSAHCVSASDSEVDDRHHPSRREAQTKPRYDIPMRSRENVRKNGKSERDYDDEMLNSKLTGAQEHMSRTRGPVEAEPRYLGRNRAASNLDPRTPPIPAAETSKRSSVRRGHSSRQASPVRQSKKDKRPPETADPPSTRKTSLPGATSDPRGLKKSFMGFSTRKEPQRSATYQPSPEYKQPSIKRSETAPLGRLRGNEFPRPSPLKNTKASSDSESSDSDSDLTEDTPPVRPKGPPKMTSYRYHNNEDSYVGEPKDISPPRARESSPNIRRSTNRPAMTSRGSTTQPPPMPRAGSHTFAQNGRSPRPGISRTESARHTPVKPHQSSRTGKPLFGAVEQPIPEEDYGTTRYPEEKSRYNKSFNRRGSEDVDPDAYPNSTFRHRPHMERHGTTYAC